MGYVDDVRAGGDLRYVDDVGAGGLRYVDDVGGRGFGVCR